MSEGGQQRLRIAFLDQYAGLGGGQQVLVDLARHFYRSGDLITVHIPGEGRTSDLLRGEWIDVRDLPVPEMTPGHKPLKEKLLYPPKAYAAAKVLQRDLSETGAEVIYANGPRTFLPAVIAAGELDIPVFCGLHLHFPRGAERRLIKWCFGRECVRGILFCSKTVAAPFCEFLENKGFIAPYWVNPNFLAAPKERDAFRQRLGIPGEAVVVGVVGRISPTKGQRLFLESVSPLLDRFKELHIVIAGSSDFERKEEEEAILDARAKCPDPSRVHLVFEMVDAIFFMDCLDVLAVPSMWEEPFGLVAVEGMARGLPLVVTRSGALPETVVDGKTGIMAEKDGASIREAVARLAGDAALRREMGSAGRTRAERDFNPDVLLPRLRQKVLEMVKSHRRQ